MIEKHFFSYNASFAQRKQLQHLIFLPGEGDTRASYLSGPFSKINTEIAGANRVLLGAVVLNQQSTHIALLPTLLRPLLRRHCDINVDNVPRKRNRSTDMATRLSVARELRSDSSMGVLPP